MFQIALVSDEHDHDVGIGVVTQFLQPPRNVDVGSMFGDIVNEKSTNCAAVVATSDRVRLEDRSTLHGDSRRGDGTVAFLSSCKNNKNQHSNTLSQALSLRAACPAPRGDMIRSTQGNSNAPVSQICAFTVFPSTLIDLVANSTPIVDLDSRLNSFLVKRERTAVGRRFHESGSRKIVIHKVGNARLLQKRFREVF